MCGRATHKLSWADIVRLLRLTADYPPSNLEPNFNLAPTEDILACVEERAARRVEWMRWGLIPFWAKETPRATFNARSDALGKPTWRDSATSFRAVIPLSGFYEWKKDGAGKTPHIVTRRNGDPLLMAGLFAPPNARLAKDGRKSAAIVTCAANAAMLRLHDRMPVVLDPSDVDDWLTGPFTREKEALLRPCPDDWLTAAPVRASVGDVRNKQPELTEPVGPPLF